MRLGGGSEPVNGLHDDVDRGVKTKRDISTGQVVVDGLGNADGVHTVLGIESMSDTERVIASDGNQRIDASGLDGLEDLLDTRFILEGVRA